jgi:two-component system OmpR family sensor kinase
MSLRTKLITGLLAMVIVAIAAISISSAWVLRSYLTSQDDTQLQTALHGLYANIVSGEARNIPVPGTTYPVGGSGDNIFAGVQEPGTSLSPPSSQSGPFGGYGQPQSVPTVPTSQFWTTLNSGKLVTVPAQSGSDTWRVITEPISYALPTSTGEEQVNGTLVVGANLGNISATIGGLAATVLIIGLIVVCILALAIVVVVRASLRPLVEIEETAGEIATGHLNRRVPERDPRTEIGSLGRSLNTMLSQIETAFHAQEASEAAAHQSEERMRRFIADASHELRTPVTSIRGFAEYYRQRGGLVRHWDRDEQPGAAGSAAGAVPAEAGLTPPDLDRIMVRVEKEAARMGLLVEDLLLLARLDKQRPLARQPVDLLSLAADAVHDARLLAPARAIDLSVQPGAAFLVIGDEPRLRQVIGNLMNNALTHTPDGTPIELSISSGALDPQVGDHTPAVILDVTDQGPGMTQEQARRVFERFYRADQARTRSTGGSGLGLAIVRALVVAQGGVASVRTAEGQGATFRIALPLAPEALGHPDDADATDDPEPADLDGQVLDGQVLDGQVLDGQVLDSQGGAGRGPDLFPVRGAVQARVHQQRVQLVQRDPGPPARRQRDRVVVADQDPVQARRAEQGEHGQVGLTVTAVRRGVDEPAPVAGPQHVPGPAVTVDPARRLGRAAQRADPIDDRLHQPRVLGPQRAGIHGPGQERQQPAVRVPLRPVRRLRRVIQRQAGDEPRPRRAEGVRAGRVQAGEVRAEAERSLGGGRAGRDHRDDQRMRADGQHLRHRDGGSLGQPAQAVRLGREHGRERPGPGRVSIWACALIRACALIWAFGGIGGREGLGEGAAAVGQRDHEVLVAVLGADDARLADGQAGELSDPDGRGGGTAHAGSSGRPSSWASRAAMTGAAAPSRSST